MDDAKVHGRRRLAMTAGRLGLLVVATATGWAAMSAAAGGHAVGAVVVGAPAATAIDPHPPAPPPPVVRATPTRAVSRADTRAVTHDRVTTAVSRDLLRGRGDLGGRRHVPR